MGNRRIGIGMVALSVLPLLAVMLMGAAVVAPPPYKHSMFTTNATSGTFTNGQVGVWDATNKQWIAGSAGSGSGGSLTTNGNQFLGVPLSIKNGAVLTNTLSWGTNSLEPWGTAAGNGFYQYALGGSYYLFDETQAGLFLYGNKLDGLTINSPLTVSSTITASSGLTVSSDTLSANGGITVGAGGLTVNQGDMLNVGNFVNRSNIYTRLLSVSNATPSRVAIIDGQGYVSNSVVTIPELALLSGKTSVASLADLQTSSNALITSEQAANANLTNLATLPSYPSHFYSPYSDGTNAQWGLTYSRPVFTETFAGDVTTVASTSASIGINTWWMANTGTGLPNLATPIADGSGVMSYISAVTTNTATGWAWALYGPAGGVPTLLQMTNVELLYLQYVRMSHTNVSGDVYAMRWGLGDVQNTTEYNNAAYFEVNTNLTNSFTFVTARNSSRTFTYNTHASNVYSANIWYLTGIYLDRRGTNVVFAVGPAGGDVLYPVATNTANVPDNVRIGPVMNVKRITSSSGTAFRTNYYGAINAYARFLKN